MTLAGGRPVVAKRKIFIFMLYSGAYINHNRYYMRRRYRRPHSIVEEGESSCAKMDGMVLGIENDQIWTNVTKRLPAARIQG